MSNTNTVESGVVILENLSKKEKANLPAGTKFYVQRTGSYGTVMESLSAHGKKQAEMTCNQGGPNHIREISDWHQCGTSPDMKKKAKKATTAATKATESTEAAAPARTVEEAEAIRQQLQASLVEAQTQAGIVGTETTVTPTTEAN